jgi:hypothetical protein
MQLGALTLLLNSTSLLSYSVEEKYQALSVRQLLDQVGAAVCPTYGTQEKKPSDYGYYHHQPYEPHECPAPGNAFDVEVKSIANQWGSFSQGLSITTYAKSATESK